MSVAAPIAGALRLALCNEVLAPWPFEQQCAYAAALGYDALEIAPFTLSDEPEFLGDTELTQFRRIAADHGLAITSLHWLLVKPHGLSITAPDAAVRARTLDWMKRLVDWCALLGGRVLVHGSPKQRTVAPGDDLATARGRAAECFQRVAQRAQGAGVVYCIEPLARNETPLINTLAEAVALVDAIGSPALRTMLDCSAAAQAEAETPAALIERWLPSGHIAHVQVNDRTRRGPGQGNDRFAEVFAALKRHGYCGTVAVEPFDYRPDGPATAARAIGYLRGILEALP